MRFRPLHDQELPDAQADEVRRNHAQAIAELQRSVASRASNIIEDVRLANATDVAIPHGLGRKFRHVTVSPVVGASSSGRVTRVVSTTYPPDRYVVLRADGFGATVTVSVEVK